MLDTWLMIKFRVFGIFYDFYTSCDPFMAKYGTYLTWLCALEQMGATSIITMNRFSCIVFPLQANKFWTKRTENTFIIVSIISTFILSIPAWMYCETTFTRINETSAVYSVIIYPAQTVLLYEGLTLIGIVVCVSQLLQYAIMFAVGYIRQRRMARNGANPNSRVLAVNIKTALTGFILSLGLTGIILFTLANVIAPSSVQDYFVIYKIVTDFFNESNPYLLLLCSSHLRQKYFRMIFGACGYGSTKVTIAQYNTNGSQPLTRRSMHATVTAH